MNERNLSRRLSASVVEALKAHGHILVVKGGATALARELDDLMAPEIVTIAPRLQPFSVLVGEPTSTFGDEDVDQAVEDMVLKLTHALMRSDHVEDVFAEDAVIRRDIFRVVRDGLREPSVHAGGDDDHASVTVKLDALGYVAATVGRRADASTLRQALDRAASVAGARFSGFSPELREATFRLEGGGDDERLELEEAVADELTDLVEEGVVDLPTIERRVDLGRALTPTEQRALRPRFAAAAEATLLRSGCAAEWELADARTLRIFVTPLSEQDAEDVDGPINAFAGEIAVVLASQPAVRAASQSPSATAPRPVVEPPIVPSAVPTPARTELSKAPPPSSRTGVAGESSSGRAPAEPVRRTAAKRVAKKAAAKSPVSSRKSAKATTSKTPAAKSKRAPAAAKATKATKPASKKR